MTMLAQLKKIENIRTTWPSEASDFTPWLCRPENLSILSEALGMRSDRLEFEAREGGVGPFRADIICRDADALDDTRVLIENQFGKSDHDHLGKLLTYASGRDNVRTVILIAEKVRDEHRAALDWLNGITGEDHHFFACELELWRIGDSLPAPRFNVVVQPNYWIELNKNRPSVKTDSPSELQMIYQSYWEDFSEALSESGLAITPRKPSAKSWMDYSAGKTGASIRLELSGQQKTLRVALHLQQHDQLPKVWFDRLHEERTQIEAEIGEPLIWDRMENNQAARIFVSRDANPNDRADWPNQHQWLIEKLKAFDDTFRQRVKRIDEIK